MHRAIALARRGRGRTDPNPMVGAVVVGPRGRVLGEGHHARAGGPHAEVVALERAGARARGATLYVTLEPCCHHGRTPPCTDAILAAGIGRVVVGMRDPNPLVAGGGIARLERAGVETLVGVREAACRALNEAWTCFITTGRPFVTLKLAASLDGRIATRTGSSRWLTGEVARAHVHRLRARSGAILVGSGTALADDPELTARGRARTPRPPLRVVVDSRARLPEGARMLHTDGGPVLVATTRAAPAERRHALARAGAELLVLPARGGRVRLAPLLERLGERGVTSVLVEGGATLAAALLGEGLADRLLLFYAPLAIGGDGLPMLDSLGVRVVGDAPRLEIERVRRFGPDVLVEARPAKTTESTCSPD